MLQKNVKTLSDREEYMEEEMTAAREPEDEFDFTEESPSEE